ncbi:hypothetical protein Patl1_26441 [Pistacia atlantica]|uniref:Uncharacterized protein n=1 Tax=Pistacia atlantica TaxID=434234 RepID=A0ACC1B167_9ROSI|nr:hypothetical protein Patl1_26441 [Pistacia atlantica]
MDSAPFATPSASSALTPEKIANGCQLPIHAIGDVDSTIRDDQVSGKILAKGPKVGRLFPMHFSIPAIISFACNAVNNKCEVARLHSPIQYSKPDGMLSFDVPTSLHRSNTNHEHDQPAHLRLRDPKIPELVNLPKYAAPKSRYCLARVYEYVPDSEDQLKLQINARIAALQGL